MEKMCAGTKKIVAEAELQLARLNKMGDSLEKINASIDLGDIPWVYTGAHTEAGQR